MRWRTRLNRARANDVPKPRTRGEQGPWKQIIREFLNSGEDATYISLPNKTEVKLLGDRLYGAHKSMGLKGKIRIQQCSPELRVYISKIEEE